MYPEANTAKKCFEENIRLFGHPKNQPEKYNLYNGLVNLVKTIEKLESSLKKIENKLDNLNRSIS